MLRGVRNTTLDHHFPCSGTFEVGPSIGLVVRSS